MTNGFQVIPAPPAAGPRQGLLVSAQRPDTAGRRWEAGIVFVPEAVNVDGVTGEFWWDGCTSDGGGVPEWTDKTTGPACYDPVEYQPFEIIEAWERPATSFGRDEYQATARRLLAAGESRKAERAFWGVAGASVGPAANSFLSEAATPTLGQGSILSALARLQQYLADTIQGRGMIHARPYVVSLWQSAGMVISDGNLLLDVFGNIIVAGQGYDGSGPDGGPLAASTPYVFEYAYATSMVQYLAGEIRPVGTYDEALDIETNTVTVRAERLIATFTDGTAQAAAGIDLTSACPEWTEQPAS